MQALSALGAPNLVVPLAEKPQLLRPLVHEDAVQLTVLDSTNLDGLGAPAHDMRVPNQRWV